MATIDWEGGWGKAAEYGNRVASGCSCPCHVLPGPAGAQWHCDVCGTTTFSLTVGDGRGSTRPIEHDFMIRRGCLARG